MKGGNIVIAGAGFAGKAAFKHILRCRKLLEGRYKVSVIDRKGCSEFLPMLPEVAGGRLNPEYVKHDTEKAVRLKGAEFINDSIENVDTGGGNLKLGSGKTVAFEYLLLSTGAETNFYGRNELRDKCLKLDTLNDALALRNRLLMCASKEKLNNVVVVGGGYTGIEIAACTRRLLSMLGKRPRIYIVERRDEILHSLPLFIRERVKEELKRLGIEAITGDSLKSYDGRTVFLENNGVIGSSLCIWSAGVKTPSCIERLRAAKVNSRIRVDRHLRIMDPFSSNVFSAGDTACFMNTPSKTPLRMAVVFSINQGALAAANIVRSIQRRELLDYRPFDPGYLIPMAHGRAEGKVLGRGVHGFVGYLLHYLLCVYRSEWTNKRGIINDIAFNANFRYIPE